MHAASVQATSPLLTPVVDLPETEEAVHHSVSELDTTGKVFFAIIATIRVISHYRSSQTYRSQAMLLFYCR